MANTRQISQPERVVPPVELGESLNTGDVKVIENGRNMLRQRITFLQGKSDRGEGEMRSPGRESITIDDDLVGSYGQLNALNSRLAGFNSGRFIVPSDPTGAVSKVFAANGMLTPEAQALIDTIPNEPARTMLKQALFEVGTFAAATTKFLTASSRVKVSELRGPVEERAFKTVQDVVGKAAEVDLSDDPALRARKRFVIYREDLANAKKSKRWDADTEETLNILLDGGRISLQDAPVPGARLGIEGQIREIEDQIAGIQSKKTLDTKDRLQLAKLRKQLADKMAQKVK